VKVSLSLFDDLSFHSPQNMKKFVAKVTLIIGLFVYSLNANSQAFIGSHLNYNHYLQLSTTGIGFGYLGMALTSEFDLGGNGIRPSINFGLPSKVERNYDLNSLSTGMYDTTITGFERYNFFNIYVDFKYFLGDGDTEYGGFYFFGGGGLSIASLTHKLVYDKNLYEPTSDLDTKQRVFQPVLRLGGGYEHSFNFGNIYAEIFSNVPANQFLNISVSINLPIMIGGQIGIKFPIG